MAFVTGEGQGQIFWIAREMEGSASGSSATWDAGVERMGK